MERRRPISVILRKWGGHFWKALPSFKSLWKFSTKSGYILQWASVAASERERERERERDGFLLRTQPCRANASLRIEAKQQISCLFPWPTLPSRSASSSSSPLCWSPSPLLLLMRELAMVMSPDAASGNHGILVSTLDGFSLFESLHFSTVPRFWSTILFSLDPSSSSFIHSERLSRSVHPFLIFLCSDVCVFLLLLQVELYYTYSVFCGMWWLYTSFTYQYFKYEKKTFFGFNDHFLDLKIMSKSSEFVEM